MPKAHVGGTGVPRGKRSAASRVTTSETDAARGREAAAERPAATGWSANAARGPEAAAGMPAPAHGSGVAVAAPPVLLRQLPPPKYAVVPLPPAVLPAAGLAGVAAALLLPVDRPGVGWLLSGLAVAAAVFVADRRSREPGDPGPFTWRSAGWAFLALALLAMGAVRASGWLFVLCVLAAVVAGSLAVVGERTVNSVLYDVLALPVEAFRAIPWVGRGAGRFTARRDGVGRRIALAVLAAAALVGVFVPLLASADAAFAAVVNAMVPDLSVATLVRWCAVFAAGALVVAGACYFLAAPPERASADRPHRTKHGLEWTVPLVVLVLVFGVFVGVRLVVLFGGTEYVLRTGGLTSAQYARGGFWQLCVVTVLTLAIVMAALRWAPNTTKADRLRQRALLGTLSVLTLVLVGSALSRMWTYQQAYGFTVLRLLVEVCELWFGAVFVLVLAALIRLRSTWLPRAAIGTAAAALLTLAVLDPERLIADANLDRAAVGWALDDRYLAGFSADVVPVVSERLQEPLRTCVLRQVLRTDTPDGWPAWNLSRSSARDVTLGPVGVCG